VSGQHPPVTAKDFKKVLVKLGFKPRPQSGTSHENWDGIYNGQRRLVTVDAHHAPFTDKLLGYMLKQLGVSKKEFYSILRAA
jgi:predicted RNA binding protein YcfA (HicA-like mRNA interferase family)